MNRQNTATLALVRHGLPVLLAYYITATLVPNIERREYWLRRLAAIYATSFLARRRWYEDIIYNNAPSEGYMQSERYYGPGMVEDFYTGSWFGNGLNYPRME